MANAEEQPNSPFTIIASSPQSDDLTRVLKHGDTFAIFDHYGDIKPAGLGEEGIYHEDTRFLSRFMLSFGRSRPLFLSSALKTDNDILAVDLANPDIFENGRVVVARGTTHIARRKFLSNGTCYEWLNVKNYGLVPIVAEFAYHFAADFADIFEVRGTKRAKKGRLLAAEIDTSAATLAYEGLDGVIRRTRLSFSPDPVTLNRSEAHFQMTLQPQQEAAVHVVISCSSNGSDRACAAPAEAWAATGRPVRPPCSTIQTSNDLFNEWIDRSAADLHMMVTETSTGPYPYAGIPWFSTPFGRDGIITALSCLWLNPRLAEGVLGYLASTQATQLDPARDAEPGKILHETRRGEMAALGEIPFGLYYGSVDSTPLFVFLAGEYYKRTGNLSFVQKIWPNVERALQWIDRYGDADGDGFVEYKTKANEGLTQQGWKDSGDSVFHRDGTLAAPPIALCEVQGYVFAAKHAAADLASALGKADMADNLRRQAQHLQERFERSFWCEEIAAYALALDGRKDRCEVPTSNAGHCLYSGIAGPERARRNAQTLLSAESHTGWGIRTVASSAIRYNPMSYHNGSVWPHDNALIAAGMGRYGLKKEVLPIVKGLFDLSRLVDLHRMPELFCGFPRRNSEGPTLYPVACAPQAWSAAAVFLILQACLGLDVRATENRIYFYYPLLPEYLKEVVIQDLRVGEASVDLGLLRHGHDVGINVMRREGEVEIVMIK